MENRQTRLCALLVASVLLIAILLAYRQGDSPDERCPSGECFRALRVDNSSVPFGYAEMPVMNLPRELRDRNRDGGSCVHVSTQMLMTWQGQHEMRDFWEQHYQGGEYSTRLHRRLDAAGLKYAFTTSGDRSFLEWAIRTRRGAGITFWPSHAVCLVGLDETHAWILDNNRIDQYVKVPKEEFFQRWKGYGGWAWTLVYNPAPPIPYADSARRFGTPIQYARGA